MPAAKKKTQSSRATTSANQSTANTKKNRTPKHVEENKASEASPKKSRRKTAKKGSTTAVAMKRLGVALLILLCAFILLFDVHTMQTNSMQPTLNKGDLVVSWSPAFTTPSFDEGQVVRVDLGDSETAPNFVRVIACDGKTVSFKDDRISIDSVAIQRLPLTNSAIARPADEPEVWRETLASGQSWRIIIPQNPVLGKLSGAITTDSATCFVAGDHRMASYDSRQTGALDKSKIKGKALFILKSANSDGFIGSFIKLI